MSRFWEWLGESVSDLLATNANLVFIVIVAFFMLGLFGVCEYGSLDDNGCPVNSQTSDC